MLCIFSTLRPFPFVLVFTYLKEMLARLLLVWRGHISSLNQILVKNPQQSDKDPAFHSPSPRSNYPWMTSLRYMPMWWTHSFSSFLSTVGFSLSLRVSCAFGKIVRQTGNRGSDPTVPGSAFSKWNQKLILQLRCSWSALEPRLFPAITHLSFLFPSLCW